MSEIEKHLAGLKKIPHEVLKKIIPKHPSKLQKKIIPKHPSKLQLYMSMFKCIEAVMAVARDHKKY